MIAWIRLWREGAIGLLLLALAWTSFGKLSAERKQARLSGELAAALHRIEGERAAIRAATAIARAEDIAHAARVDRERTNISLEVDRDYQEQLADLRRRHDALRLRSAPPGADRSGGGTAPMPGIPDAARGPDGAAGEARLSASDALIASQQALQLKALQDWSRAQAIVEQ
jgi:hypothetical protein